ncbi:hypothetical protein BJ165DRAFT_1534177 [Panaeolus papilionaceus]|nr:hypothetical protein BJ165DRAFT_1534177 [Panaeolus papilionaceus]
MRCRQTLQHFRVEYWWSQVFDHGLGGGFSNLNGPIIFPNVCDALSSIRGNNALKTLGVHFNFYHSHPREWLKDFASIWERLDYLLAGNGGSGFPYLEQIELSTDVVYDSYGSPTDAVSDDVLWDTWTSSLTLLCSTFTVTQRKSKVKPDRHHIKSYHLELLHA